MSPIPPEQWPLKIRLFGQFEWLVEGSPPAKMRTRKEYWLLALLTLADGRSVLRRHLAQTLWPFPDYFEDRAQSNLRRSLAEIRRALGTQSWRLTAVDSRSLVLDVTGCWVDVLCFDRALASGTAESAEEAVTVYRGPLLADCEETWAALERETRLEKYQRLLLDHGKQALSVHDPNRSIHLLRLAVAANPFWEPAQRALMESLAANNEHEAAVQVYQRYSKALRGNQDATPSADTTALFIQIRETARSRADLASRSLQVSRSAAQSRSTGRFPRPITRVIGRDKERRDLAVRVRKCRLVTLVGTGGIGKTRLALDMAAELQAAFRDGVWFVGLAHLTQGAFVVREVATALGIREEPEADLEQTIQDHLQEKALLIILDNCEHVVPACAQVANGLLARCAGVHILATSRQPLGITGESTLRVPSLAAPDPRVMPTGDNAAHVAANYAAVELFVERASAQGEFALTTGNASLVAQICHALDGIPLAIELAAARINVLSVADIARGLSDRFELLSKGSSVVLPRHQTLRELVNWSYGLLTKDEQDLFGRLSVFRGDWTLDAAIAICGEGTGWSRIEAVTLVDGLFDKSLIVADMPENGVRRFRLYETIREYAAERLSTVVTTALRRSHAVYYLAIARQAEPGLSLKRQGSEAQALMEGELANLQAALEWCLTEGRESETGLALAVVLSAFWYMRGYFRTAWEHLTTALSNSEIASLSATHAKTLKSAGRLAWLQGDYRGASTCFAESLRIYRELGRQSDVAATLCYLGLIASHEGDYDLAGLLFTQGRTILRDVGDETELAHVLSCLGDMAWFQGNFELANELQEQSLAIARRLDNRHRIAYSLTNLGNIDSELGSYARAKERLDEALRLFLQLGDQWGIGITLWSQGNLSRLLGQNDKAAEQLRQAIAIGCELNNSWGVAFAMESLAFVETARKRPDLAARNLGFADCLRQAIGSPVPEFQRRHYDKSLALVQAALGREQFDHFFNLGRTLTIETCLRELDRAPQARV